uniref:Uncharacterized protein n=1 Tax=Anguilla anguilla TaxID=7936 RepID=A0A0E9WDL8_ANGAN
MANATHIRMKCAIGFESPRDSIACCCHVICNSQSRLLGGLVKCVVYTCRIVLRGTNR